MWTVFKRYRFFIQKSVAIAFVPPNFVRASWDGLKIYGIWPQADIHTHNFRKCSHASVGLTHHFYKTWMNGQFRPRMWNFYAHSGPRTITWKDGATEWRELQERHTQICMITWKNSVEHQNSLIIIGINGKRIFYTFFYIYFYNLKWPSKSEIIL